MANKRNTHLGNFVKAWRNFNNKRELIAAKNLDDNATKMPMLRSQFIGMTFMAGFVILGLKAGYLTLFRPLDLARTSAQAEAMKQAPRADIIDRNGVLLATSLPSFSLYADPEKIWDAAETATAIRTVFPQLEQEDLIDKLASTKRFVWIKRRMTPQQKQEIWALGQPGLEFEEETKRVYPMGQVAGHMIGAINGEGRGIDGLERGLEGLLTTGDLSRQLKLSLDSRVQTIVEAELGEAAAKYRANHGAAAIMDIRTGEIIAAASWPAIDPNRYGSFSDAARTNVFNSSLFEMGSTFKPFTFAVAIEDKLIDENSQFNVSRPLQIGDFAISDYHGTKSVLSAREVLEYSSNIGTGLIARMVGAPRLIGFFDSLGLLSKVNGEIMGAPRPRIPRKWGVIHTVTTSYGQGLSVSPLAVLAAYGALANGGIYIKPTFIAKNGNSPTTGRRVISTETSRKIVSLLRAVVTSGTGQTAQADYYLVGGKTGTANKPVTQGTGYDASKRVSSFAGIFPANNPQYAFLFLLDEPQGIDGGAATANIVTGPSVSRIVTRVAPMLGVAPSRAILADNLPANNTNIAQNVAVLPPKTIANKTTPNIALGAR